MDEKTTPDGAAGCFERVKPARPHTTMSTNTLQEERSHGSTDASAYDRSEFGDEIADPILDSIRELGPEEVLRRLNPRRHSNGTGNHDGKCPECDVYYTETELVGEVGHQAGCPRREERYTGSTGRKQTVPDDKACWNCGAYVGEQFDACPRCNREVRD